MDIYCTRVNTDEQYVEQKHEAQVVSGGNRVYEEKGVFELIRFYTKFFHSRCQCCGFYAKKFGCAVTPGNFPLTLA